MDKLLRHRLLWPLATLALLLAVNATFNPGFWQLQRRGAVQDVDHAAVQMAVAPLQLPEAGVEHGVDGEQQRERDEWPQQPVTKQTLHHASAAIRW